MRTLVFDTRLRKLIKPLLDIDPIIVLRPTSTVDGEGDLNGNRTTVLTGVGTFTEATDTEQLAAAERGTRVDKVLVTELGLDIQGGDFISSAGVLWEVVTVDSRRLNMRVQLRLDA